MLRTNLKTGKTLYRNILSHFGNELIQQVLYRQIRILDEFLLKQANFGNIFIDLSGNDLIDNVLRFAGIKCLRLVNLFLALNQLCRNFFTGYSDRI